MAISHFATPKQHGTAEQQPNKHNPHKSITPVIYHWPQVNFHPFVSIAPSLCSVYFFLVIAGVISYSYIVPECISVKNQRNQSFHSWQEQELLSSDIKSEEFETIVTGWWHFVDESNKTRLNAPYINHRVLSNYPSAPPALITRPIASTSAKRYTFLYFGLSPTKKRYYFRT